MSTMNELVPLSQIHSQYSIVDERQIPKYQAWSPETSSVPFMATDSNTDESAAKSDKKNSTIKILISILIGLVICGIPLAVVASLYAQKKNSSNINTGSTSSNGTSLNLPTQCSTYMTNSDPTRLATFIGCTNCFYDTSLYFPTNWYRFTNAAGTQLVSMPPNTGSCGALYPAWYNGTYPSTPGATISSIVCVHASGILCSPLYPISISVTNCSGFYVFYLPSATNGNIRYCTTF